MVTWGDENNGGSLTDSSRGLRCGSSAPGVDLSCLVNVEKIFSNTAAFAVLKTDGTVVTWGGTNKGGDSSSVSGSLTNVQEIFSVYGICSFKN